MEKISQELKKLAELKATALNMNNDILFDESESKAMELCWTRRPEMGNDLFSQETYDEYYAYYQECVNHLENEGKIPATKIKNETMTIIGDGSRVVGCCSFETPYVVLRDTTGREYIWCSNTVEQKDMLGRVGEQVTVTAFIRPCTGHLYRVKVTLLGQINKLQEELKMWQESVVTTEKLDDRTLIFDRIDKIKEELEYLS